MKTSATLLLLGLTALTSQAALVWSGIVDIPIPAATGPGAGLNGVYVDIAGVSAINTADDSFALTDVNFFLGGYAIRSSGNFLPARLAPAATSPVLNLLPGTVVDASLNFGPVGIGASSTHLGSGPGKFDSGSEGYIGFTYSDNGGPAQNGWMRVTLTNNGSGGVIHEWVIQTNPSSGITVGVPEPATATLALLSLSALLRRRRLPFRCNPH